MVGVDVGQPRAGEGRQPVSDERPGHAAVLGSRGGEHAADEERVGIFGIDGDRLVVAGLLLEQIEVPLHVDRVVGRARRIHAQRNERLATVLRTVEVLLEGAGRVRAGSEQEDPRGFAGHGGARRHRERGAEDLRRLSGREAVRDVRPGLAVVEGAP